MSTLKTNTIKNTDDVEMYLAKAWVNFDGTGTVTIRAAGNVSSITDNGVGDYTVNFISAMVDANYSAVVTAARTAGITIGDQIGAAPNTSSVSVSAGTTANTRVDADAMYVAIFR